MNKYLSISALTSRQSRLELLHTIKIRKKFPFKLVFLFRISFHISKSVRNPHGNSKQGIVKCRLFFRPTTEQHINYTKKKLLCHRFSKNFWRICYIFRETYLLISKFTKLEIIWYRNFLNIYVEKARLVRISRQPLTVTIMINQKQLENIKCLKYLRSL
jgi:hypothetical protein